jgi:phosphoenolpyruvate-protein kinase (PTS system EI component)
MDVATVLVDVVIALWFAAVMVGVARAFRVRATSLRPLTAQEQNRYQLSWERIRTRFVHAPKEAAEEADTLVVAMLRARGQVIRDDRLPGRLLDARKWLAREHSHGTEALRQAMLHYSVAFDHGLGRRPREKGAIRRREIA